jgi:beta-lactamase superfamily II metal-dependent hydrolase
MRLQIFDVEHGACALLTCDNATRIMIDCGHNATSRWYPGSYLSQQGIWQVERLAITNYDEDHVSGIENLFANVSISELWRNTSVSADQLCYLKSEDGMGRGIAFLADKMANVYTGGPVNLSGRFQGMTHWQVFCNRYPLFDDENNLSLTIFFKCQGVGVLFPGDLEGEGWRALMWQPGFCDVLRQTDVFIASHHGRENGWCDELKEFCNPFYVVISDQGYQYDTQKTVPRYSSLARGGPFRLEQMRKVLTTRSDGRIAFDFSPGSWGPS